MNLKKKHNGFNSKIFVLDTNVLFHDPKSLFKFAEHDIYLSLHVLEDLDHNKKGMSEIARNARQASRILDSLIQQCPDGLENGIPLKNNEHGEMATGKFYLQTDPIDNYISNEIPFEKDGNQIISLVKQIQENHLNRTVILVSKDINMRIKAKVLGLLTQDYFNDQVADSSERLRSGIQELSETFDIDVENSLEKWSKDGYNFYKLKNIDHQQRYLPNQFLYYKKHKQKHSSGLQVQSASKETIVLRSVHNFFQPKSSIWGIFAKNLEQNFALNLLMDPNIHLVSMVGAAGTGKTLLALAAGLTQTLETQKFSEIIITRNTLPIGEDIGFLPGTQEEKMNPWMGAIEDNLELLNKTTEGSGQWGRAATQDILFSKISIKSLNFMRGRTFTNKFLIIDEAQNLTPQQMKTLITRAGQGTKVICLGNTLQIDAPFLTEENSGLTYVVDRFKTWDGAGHIKLTRGERSKLADYATKHL